MSYIKICIYIFLLLSGVIFSVQICKPTFRTMAKALLFINGAVLSIYAGVDYFTGEGVNDAVIYHFNVGLSGAGFFEYWKLICALVTFVVFFPLFVWFLTKQWLTLCGINETDPAKMFLIGPLLIFCAIFISPLGFDLYTIYNANIITTPKIQSGRAKLPVVQVEQKKRVSEKIIYDLELKKNYDSGEKPYNLVAKQTSAQLSEVLSSHEPDQTNTYKDNNYRKPLISKNKEKTKNLVYIYAESLERTYFDESLFPNLMSGIKKIIKANTVDFTDIRQISGTGWTIAGMVASQCGIPLYTTSPGNTMGHMDEFLPLAVCLGDLLSVENYDLSFYGGAKLSFAGKGKFYASHQFDEIKGLHELGNASVSKNSWGLYDDYLFDRVYERFVELTAESKKFALFTLSLDTHHPTGHRSPSCEGVVYADGKNAMLNSVKCSDKLISDLVQRMLESPYADDTIIVVASDHLAMKNQAWDILSENQDKRRNLLLVIDSSLNSSSKKNNSPGTTLDITPTLLPKMGFDLDMGLGRNLNLERSVAVGSAAQMKSSWRRMVLDFWNFPTVKKGITIMPDNKVSVDGRIFSTPALLTFDDQLNTVMKFSYFTRSYFLAEELDGNSNFLLIDRCDTLPKINLPIKDSIHADAAEFQSVVSKCFFMGKEKVEIANKINVSDLIKLSRKSLQTFFSSWAPDAEIPSQ